MSNKVIRCEDVGHHLTLQGDDRCFRCGQITRDAMQACPSCGGQPMIGVNHDDGSPIECGVCEGRGTTKANQHSVNLDDLPDGWKCMSFNGFVIGGTDEALDEMKTLRRRNQKLEVVARAAEKHMYTAYYDEKLEKALTELKGAGNERQRTRR